MNDKHPTYQKVLYVACWIILVIILVIITIRFIRG
jgi:hypothetical protein